MTIQPNWWDTCICGKKAPDDYKPATCCDGFECGCMGKPIEPYLCSDECIKKFDEQYINGSK